MNVLFVCLGNVCRSPMAAAWMEYFVRSSKTRGIEVLSAGLLKPEDMVFSTAHPRAVQAMAHYGISLEGHTPQRLTRTLLLWATHVYVLDRSVRAQIRAQGWWTDHCQLLAEAAGFGPIDITDPVRGTPEAFAGCASLLREAVQRVFVKLMLPEDKP